MKTLAMILVLASAAFGQCYFGMRGPKQDYPGLGCGTGGPLVWVDVFSPEDFVTESTAPCTFPPWYAGLPVPTSVAFGVTLGITPASGPTPLWAVLAPRIQPSEPLSEAIPWLGCSVQPSFMTGLLVSVMSDANGFGTLWIEGVEVQHEYFTGMPQPPPYVPSELGAVAIGFGPDGVYSGWNWQFLHWDVGLICGP